MQNFERVRDIVHDVTGIPADLITADSTAEGLNVDSLDLTEIIMAVEDEFDIIVEDESSIQSVRDLINRIDEQVA